MTQIEYCEILFQDLGFTTAQKRDFLALRYKGRRHLDELTIGELRFLIDDLKNRKQRPEVEEEE